MRTPIICLFLCFSHFIFAENVRNTQTDKLIDQYFQLLSKEKILQDLKQGESSSWAGVSGESLQSLKKLESQEREQLAKTLKNVRAQIDLLEKKNPKIAQIAKELKSPVIVAPRKNSDSLEVIKVKESE